MPAQAWFLYGLRPAGTPPGALDGIDAIMPDSRVEILARGRLDVLASRVPRHLFDADDPAHRTADPDWIGQRVAAYHAVNAAAASAGPFLPVAFGTLFSSQARLQAWLGPLKATVLSALGRLDGRREWQLTLQADGAALGTWIDRHDPSVQALADAISRLGAGTAFLAARRLHKTREAACAAHLARHADRVGGLLAQAGVELSEPPEPGRTAWTLLLADPAVADLERRLEPLAGPDEAGLSLRLTGPWPAYGFARAALAAGTDVAPARLCGPADAREAAHG